jgi:hypothetical protein
MTEQEWLTAIDPHYLFKKVHGFMFERKLRLFAIACCNRVSTLCNDSLAMNWLSVAEMYADGQAQKPQRQNAEGEAHRAGTVNGYLVVCTLHKRANEAASRSSSFSADAVARAAVPEFFESTKDTEKWSRVLRSERQKEFNAQADLLRDIFGNPFRPITLLPEWRTSTVLALATGIYEEKAFDRMPILADALGDAGCDNEEILQHCRSETVHTRGCFVVDLILGKE